MTVNEFAQDVHKNAVAHGWYDAPITFPEVAVMIHAEISEAVEEWRSGNPVIYGTCALSPENCKFSKICDNDYMRILAGHKEWTLPHGLLMAVSLPSPSNDLTLRQV